MSDSKDPEPRRSVEVFEMTRPYSPLAIANGFLTRCAKQRDQLASEEDGIEHLKLQKLVYFAYGWWIAYMPDPLISEGPQVWTHGPVFSSLYHSLKDFGRRPIQGPQSTAPFLPLEKVAEDDEEANQLLDWVWNRYRGFSAFDLSDMTHRKGTPWQRIAEENSFRVPRGTVIPDEYIKQEFRALGARDQTQ